MRERQYSNTSNILKILTFVVYIFPVLPLGILSVCVIVFGLSSFVFNGVSGSVSLTFIIYTLWVLGGLSGLIGGVKLLIGEKSTVVFMLVLHGAISYAVIAIGFIVSASPSQPVSMLIAGYFAFSLMVIATQLLLLAKQLWGRGREEQNKEELLNAVFLAKR